MALHDQRVFKAWQNWWVGTVQLSSGDVASGSRERESIIFTCLSGKARNAVTGRLAAGYLNRVSHRAIVQILHGAEDTGSRKEMIPYNMPNEEELRTHTLVTDEEGLRWALRPTQTVSHTSQGLATSPGIDCVCLDDSALRKDVAIEGGDLDSLVRLHGEAGLEAIISAVKSVFIDDIKPYL